MCQCTPNYDVRCLCTPDMPTWSTCPEKLRYAQVIIENTSDLSELDIYVDETFSHMADIQFLFNPITIDDIKAHFQLNDTEMHKLLYNFQHDWLADNMP